MDDSKPRTGRTVNVPEMIIHNFLTNDKFWDLGGIIFARVLAADLAKDRHEHFDATTLAHLIHHA